MQTPDAGHDAPERDPPGPDPLELDADAMRRMGYAVVDRLVERIAGLDSEPAWRGGDRASLERIVGGPPSEPLPFDELLRTLADDVLTRGVRVDHPRFLAFVPGAPTWPGILADFLAAGYDVFQGTWLGSAGASAVELVVLDWFRAWIGYPERAAGLFVSGGSAANLTAIACARLERLGGHDPDAVVYLSEEAHSSVARAFRVLGFHPDRIRRIAVDDDDRLAPDALRNIVAADRANGLRPFLVAASAGTTSTGAIDPLADVADACAELGLWLHVDAAYGGFAVLTDRGRAWLHGLDRADSVALDPHKWLYQPFECGCLMVRDGAALERSFRVAPAYLQDTDVRRRGEAWDHGEGAVNFGDRGIQLTRSARALKVWLSIRCFGLDAFRAAIDRTLDLAEWSAARIAASDALELLTPARLGIVCFHRRFPADAGDPDALHAALVRRLADSGEALISSTRVRGATALRFCILGHRTTRADLERAIRWLEHADIAQP